MQFTANQEASGTGHRNSRYRAALKRGNRTAQKSVPESVAEQTCISRWHSTDANDGNAFLICALQSPNFLRAGTKHETVYTKLPTACGAHAACSTTSHAN